MKTLTLDEVDLKLCTARSYLDGLKSECDAHGLAREATLVCAAQENCKAAIDILRGRAEAAQVAHNHQVAGASPAPATILPECSAPDINSPAAVVPHPSARPLSHAEHYRFPKGRW